MGSTPAHRISRRCWPSYAACLKSVLCFSSTHRWPNRYIASSFVEPLHMGPSFMVQQFQTSLYKAQTTPQMLSLQLPPTRLQSCLAFPWFKHTRPNETLLHSGSTFTNQH